MLDQILVIVGVTALVLIAPGPDMIIVMRNTLVDGRTAGYKTSLGILAGNVVHITYCVIGIGWLISKSIVAFSVLKYAGAAYLVYLGISSFRSPNISLDVADAEEHHLTRSWFTQGFINNVLNPKGTLFFLGVFTTVITPETSTSTTTLLVSIMIAMCAIFWLMFVQSLDTTMVRQFFERSQNFVQNIFGVVLIALGLRVALISR